ncbi:MULTISPECIES: GerMN domain-containing protein [Clostridium]|uniref:GerMN domain-containing protein n=1 Tax=Clostridium TaxID=1485 RepID=UPI00069DDED7|nr:MULTISPECIES: GerMN domain-containing protein [Clostridium]KOF57546.1 sporulation/spore germination protein [Clostridium sp. DMHC 10]MCD2348335.1 GerMN domain-containing protein [Clostridium guangxiense]
MKRLIALVLGISIVTASSMTFSGCEKKDKSSINTTEKIKELKLYKENSNVVDFNLYFDSSKNEQKAEEAKEERMISKNEIIGEIIINELIKGPAVNSKLKPVLPTNTKLLSFSIKDGIAYVSLSDEAKVKMTPAKEEATLKSIVKSLGQLEAIKSVKILIDNNVIDTLGGNYDISKPINKNSLENLKKITK